MDIWKLDSKEIDKNVTKRRRHCVQLFQSASTTTNFVYVFSFEARKSKFYKNAGITLLETYHLTSDILQVFRILFQRLVFTFLVFAFALLYFFSTIWYKILTVDPLDMIGNHTTVRHYHYHFLLNCCYFPLAISFFFNIVFNLKFR